MSDDRNAAFQRMVMEDERRRQEAGLPPGPAAGAMPAGGAPPVLQGGPAGSPLEAISGDIMPAQGGPVPGQNIAEIAGQVLTAGDPNAAGLQQVLQQQYQQRIAQHQQNEALAAEQRKAQREREWQRAQVMIDVERSKSPLQRDYEFYREQGGHENFLNYQMRINESAADRNSTNINTQAGRDALRTQYAVKRAVDYQGSEGMALTNSFFQDSAALREALNNPEISVTDFQGEFGRLMKGNDFFDTVYGAFATDELNDAQGLALKFITNAALDDLQNFKGTTTNFEYSKVERVARTNFQTDKAMKRYMVQQLNKRIGLLEKEKRFATEAGYGDIASEIQQQIEAGQQQVEAWQAWEPMTPEVREQMLQEQADAALNAVMQP